MQTKIITCKRRYQNPPDDRWRDSDSIRVDGTCSYCGSLDPDVLMERLERGDVELGTIDSAEKVYVSNAGGAPLPNGHATFFYEHLNVAQQKRFEDLYQMLKLRFSGGVGFVKLPFFITPATLPL